MSTRDPIEDLFRDNQHELDEKPRDLIWDRIEERLDEKPVLKKKKKSNVWKYAVAACAIVGISLAGFIVINQNFAADYPENSTSVVLESVELNEEKASEILDQLEAESTAIVTTKSNAPTPEIMEEELKKPGLVSPKTPMEPAAEISVYDAPVMAAPAAAQMEMESVKPMTKQEDIQIYSTGNYAKKEQNKEIGNLDFESRRLGNRVEKSVSYDTIYVETIVKQLPVKISSKTIKYDLIYTSNDTMVYENKKIAYPTKVTLFKTQNNKIEVQFQGNKKKENASENLEIQSFFKKNKIEIFGLGIQID
jgi:hypothetical protein